VRSCAGHDGFACLHCQLTLSCIGTRTDQCTGLNVTYTLQADIDLLPEAIEETLWKVSQEALTNIEKHAHANQVQMRISRQDEKLLLSIHDDGIGLPQVVYQPQKEGSFVYSGLNGHYGLRGMRERIEAVGGHLALRSGEGQGTTIEVELPLENTVNSFGSVT
jgi:signal transduction histidine kinase